MWFESKKHPNIFVTNLKYNICYPWKFKLKLDHWSNFPPIFSMYCINNMKRSICHNRPFQKNYRKTHSIDQNFWSSQLNVAGGCVQQILKLPIAYGPISQSIHSIISTVKYFFDLNFIENFNYLCGVNALQIGYKMLLVRSEVEK